MIFSGTIAYDEVFAGEPELNQFKHLLFDEKIGLLSGARQYNVNNNISASAEVARDSDYELENFDKANEDPSQNFTQWNIHTDLKDSKHTDSAFLEKVKKNVFALSNEEYLLLRKSIHLSNTAIYFFIRGWDPKFLGTTTKIARIVVDNLAWRWIYTPEKTEWEDIVESAKPGSMFDFGFDKFGHPMIYMVIGREDLSRKLDERAILLRYRHLCLCFEKMMSRLYDGSSQNYLGKGKDEFLGNAPFQLTWVVDVKDAPLSIDLVKKIKFIFDLLGFYYPERSESVYVMNVPFFGKLLWAVICQFLSQRQRDQYQFLHDSPYVKNLSEKIDMKFISSDLNISGVGGTTDASYKFNLANRIRKYKEFPYSTKWI